MKKNHRWIVLAVVLCAVLMLLQSLATQKQQQSGVHVFNDKALGLSLAKSYLAEQVHLNKQAFHRAEELAQFDLVVVHNPKFALSGYELAELKNYILNGGTVWLNAIDPYEFNHLKASILFSNNFVDAASEYKMQKNPDFENKKTQKMSWPGFGEVDAYGAYHWVKVHKNEKNKKKSEQNLKDDQSLPSTSILHWRLGAGSVVLYAGIPPYANAMLASKDNQDFLRYVKHTYPQISWDVYHHYIKQAGFKDVLKDIQVVVPMFCFLLFLLLYFFCAPKRKNILDDTDSPAAVPSYHMFYQGLMTQAFAHGEGREQAFAYVNEQSSRLYGLKKHRFMLCSDMSEHELKQKWKEKIKELNAYFQKRS